MFVINNIHVQSDSGSEYKWNIVLELAVYAYIACICNSGAPAHRASPPRDRRVDGTQGAGQPDHPTHYSGFQGLVPGPPHASGGAPQLCEARESVGSLSILI